MAEGTSPACPSLKRRGGPRTIGAGATLMVLAGVAGALGLAACGSSKPTTAAASQCVAGSGITGTARTAHYVMVLDVGAAEQMYTQAQVASQHPMSGEVMLGGQMAPVPGMSMGSGAMSSTTMGSGAMSSTTTMGSGAMSSTTTMGSGAGASAASYRHLEVHICDRATGAVVTNAHPAITLVDRSANNMAEQVPVAVMESIGEGVRDLHYGNNVLMPPGHTYTVTVMLNGERATFSFARPM